MFEGSEKFDPKTKNMELQLTNNLQPTRASCSSSDHQMRTRVYNDRCCRYLLDSSPVAITNRCLHKFCVKCILYLWSRQKLREPCICPLDDTHNQKKIKTKQRHCEF